MVARRAAFGDLNNGGCLEAVVNCRDQEPVIIQNLGGNTNHSLTINTVGAARNRDGIGAGIRVVSTTFVATTVGGQQAIISTAGGYLSSSDKRLHFGLGQDKVAKLIEIHWPSGCVKRLQDQAADQILTVHEPRT